MSKISQKDKNAIIPPLEKMDNTPKLVLSSKSISKMAQLESMAKSYDLPTPKWHFDSKVKKRRRRANTSLISSSILSEPIIDDLEETISVTDNGALSNNSKETTNIGLKSEKSEIDQLQTIIIEPSDIVRTALTPVPITFKAVSPVLVSKALSPIIPPVDSPIPPTPPPQKKAPPPPPRSTKKSPSLQANLNSNGKKKKVFTNFVLLSGVVTTLFYIIIRGQQLTSLQAASGTNGETNNNNLNDKKVSFPSVTTPKSSNIQSNSTLNATDSTTSSSIFSLNCYKTCVSTNLLNDNQLINFLSNYTKTTWNVLVTYNLQNQPNLAQLTLNETLVSNVITDYKKSLNDIILSNLNSSTCYSSCNNLLSTRNNSNHSHRRSNTFVYFLIIVFVLNIS